MFPVYQCREQNDMCKGLSLCADRMQVIQHLDLLDLRIETSLLRSDCGGIHALAAGITVVK